MSAASLGAELTLGPEPGELGEIAVGPSSAVPAELHEIFEGKFVSFEMADVDDPNAVGAVFPGKRQLVPNLGNGAGVDPLIAARAAVVIEMIIDAGAAGAFAFLGRRATGARCPSYPRPTRG